MSVIQTASQRLAGVIAQVILENAQLGEVVEKLREEIIQERVRADAAEQRLKELEEK